MRVVCQKKAKAIDGFSRSNEITQQERIFARIPEFTDERVSVDCVYIPAHQIGALIVSSSLSCWPQHRSQETSFSTSPHQHQKRKIETYKGWTDCVITHDRAEFFAISHYFHSMDCDLWLLLWFYLCEGGVLTHKRTSSQSFRNSWSWQNLFAEFLLVESMVSCKLRHRSGKYVTLSN